jgi:hypothetical protein
MLVLVFCALGHSQLVAATDPPQPDFFWPYGRILSDGENAGPQMQRVIALVNGRACGEATTKVADAGPGVPQSDVGATVYVIDVLAAGSNAGQRLGCGLAGDPVMLYFVGSRRFAQQEPLFMAGSQRVDVDLGPELAFQLTSAMIAGDAGN